MSGHDTAAGRQGTRPPSAGFDALFESERRPMLRLAVLLVDSPATAEEIVQDAFAGVAERWHELERPGAYLRTSVVNGCRMALRHRDAQRRLDRPQPMVPIDAPTELVELRRALASLAARQRIVLVLRYFDDLPDAEIAELVGCRPATVRSLAARGLRNLRRELT